MIDVSGRHSELIRLYINACKQTWTPIPFGSILIAPAVCKIVRYRTRLGAACTSVSDLLVRQIFVCYLPHSFTVLAHFCARPKKWMQIPDQMCLHRAIGPLIPRKTCPYRRIAFGSTDASTLLITVRTPSYLGVACSWRAEGIQVMLVPCYKQED